MAAKSSEFDARVYAALAERSHGISATYVVYNILRREHGMRDVKTPRVLRSLKRLEAAGKVKRVPTSYAVMISWAPVSTSTGDQS